MLFPGTARILRAHLSWDRTHTACASRGGSNSDYYEPITVSPIGSAILRVTTWLRANKNYRDFLLWMLEPGISSWPLSIHL